MGEEGAAGDGGGEEQGGGQASLEGKGTSRNILITHWHYEINESPIALVSDCCFSDAMFINVYNQVFVSQSSKVNNIFFILGD